MIRIILICLLSACCVPAFAQYNLNGRIINKLNEGIEGVTVKVAGTATTYSTDANGNFSLPSKSASLKIICSALGYQTKEINIELPLSEPLTVLLTESINELSEVTVSTGYQRVAKERATGSFVLIDSALINRKTGTDILGRLADVVPGLIFNRNLRAGVSETDISIRGQSTIFATTQPLIVLDDFPFEGDLSNINPNDVESITVLKDAAAASIWGARAGNGVIVINTRRGKFNSAPKLEFNSNYTIGNRPDLFYNPQMSSADYIGMEKLLFERGYYKATETSTSNASLSPVVELLIAARDGKITNAAAEEQIQAFGAIDVRNEYESLFNRQSVATQNALSLTGGTAQQRYNLSAGYDRNLLSLKKNSFSRLTLKGNQTYRFLKDKMELTTGVYFTQNTQVNNNNDGVPVSGLYPYAKFADENGQPLAVTGSYRLSFLESALDKGLLDWQLRPLEELELADNKANLRDYRANMALSYSILPWLKSSVLYQYARTDRQDHRIYTADSYFTRNLINNYTQVNPDGTLTRAIPMGSIADKDFAASNSHNLRALLEVNKNWDNMNSLSGIVGAEIRDDHSISNSFRMFGYDEEHATSSRVDLVGLYPIYSSSLGTQAIPGNESETDLTNRYLSYFANAAYRLLDKYTLSASSRIDRSNLFGVKSNQQSVPLYSVGAAWEINKERFFKADWLPYLRLRATFGYNGNVDRSLSAYTTASYQSGSNSLTRLPFATIINPPNPELRWERVKITNFGLDFRIKNQRISGSIEYFQKRGIDLIGTAPFPASTGITSFKGNTANTSGQGVDLTLHGVVIQSPLTWTSDFMFSYIDEKVTSYKIRATVANYMGGGVYGSYPLEGKPLAAIYSYPWGGLDPQNGNPIGYLEGLPSSDYAKIIREATMENVIYNGPARPPYFGAFRNTFSYRGFSLSANISYRLGYYYRKKSITYTGVLNGRGGHGNFAKRWQKPGEELITNVPSLPSSANNNRDNLYTFSEALVRRADHVRLQDLQLNFTPGRKFLSSIPFSGLQIYAYANNLGLIWAETKDNTDPDYQLSRPIRTISVGIKAGL